VRSSRPGEAYSLTSRPTSDIRGHEAAPAPMPVRARMHGSTLASRRTCSSPQEGRAARRAPRRRRDEQHDALLGKPADHDGVPRQELHRHFWDLQIAWPSRGAFASAQTRAPESGPPCAHLGQGSTSRGPRAARSCVASRISSASLPACRQMQHDRVAASLSAYEARRISRPGGPAASGESHRQSCVPKLVSTMSPFKTRVSYGTRFRTCSQGWRPDVP
jgi:hypothetical protein